MHTVYDGAEIELQQGYQLQVDQLRPFSVGEVTLRSADPKSDPKVQFNYLSDARDIAQLVDDFEQGLICLGSPLSISSEEQGHCQG